MACKLAKSDFDKGKYLLIRWGLPENKSIIIGEVLRANYQIDQIYGGCAGNDEVDCYTNTMASLLLKKYGSDFYQKVIHTANKIHAERKKTNPLY